MGNFTLIAAVNVSCFSAPPITELQYLSFCEIQCLGELCLPPDGDVPAVVELLLQLQPLVVAVHHPVLVFCSRAAWKMQINFLKE